MSKLKVRDNVAIFKCPICSNKMELRQLKSLICQSNHCFDLAKSGYINFLLRSLKTDYDKSMLKSRNIICKYNFFRPLVEEISKIILKEVKNDAQKMILDVGCGEGSHLDQIIAELHSRSSLVFQGVGIDISKEAIQLASKQYPEHIWCVGDLANSPLQNNQFAVILNILSPSNYAEFARLLTNNGILIKVVPGGNYLKELREVFYAGTEKQSYSNAKVVAHFKENFTLLAKKELQYSVKLTQPQVEHLIRMTPLSWKISAEKIEEIMERGLDEVTVEFTIIYGKHTAIKNTEREV
jgi:23S rRNA (guanine745-N1)-methyltransferase